jgi:hypothetical protein
MRHGGAWPVAILLGALGTLPAGSESAPPTAPGAPEAAPPDEDAAKRLAERTRRIRSLIDALENDDPTVLERVRRELVETGPDVLPHLEEVLRRRRMLEHARLLATLEEQAAPARPIDRPAFDRALPAAADAEKAARPSDGADRYVTSKYNEAVLCYQKKEFEKAAALAAALLILEPKSSLKPKLFELRRYAELQVTQQQVLVATLVPEKEQVAIGEDIRLTLRFENVSPTPVRLEFGTGPTGKGKAVGDVFATLCDPLGMRRTAQGSVEWDLPGEIALPPKGTWEQGVTVRANAAEEDDVLDPAFLRIYQIGARLVAVRVWVGDARERRRVEAEACTLRAFPKGTVWRDADPLVGLGKTLDDIERATLNDLFLAAMRVPRKDTDKAAGLLVRALPRFGGAARQVLLEALRELTGLDFGYDVKKWLTWGKVKIDETPKPVPPGAKPEERSESNPDAKPDPAPDAQPGAEPEMTPEPPPADPPAGEKAAPGR